MKRTSKLLFLFAALSAILAAGSLRADLAERIDAILARPENRQVSFSIHVIEADTGHAVYDHDATELMIPASNMKLITTAAALHYLGADYEYVTKVGLCGQSLVVIGSGDPLLGDRRNDARYGRDPGWIFNDIARALKRKGITVIKDIIVDSSIFDAKRVHPNWPVDQLNRWYAAEVCGLNYNDNCIDIIVKNIDGRIVVATDPQTTFLELINEITPVPEAPSAIGAYRNRQPNRLTLKGRCRTQATIADLAIEKPAAYFAFLLAEDLAASDIKPLGRFIEKAGIDCDEFVPLAEYTTPIADCLMRCNKNSLGLVAECLLKTIAAESSPGRANGSWELGCELISRYLSDLGIDASQFYIDDGSGLSRVNELTAYAVTKVLRNLYTGPDWALYRDSLAVGGVDGTIEKYFYREKYRGRIRAKTGYIRGVRALSGLCETKKGDYIFSILANNANGLTRTTLNDIARAIIDEAEPGPPKSPPDQGPAKARDPNQRRAEANQKPAGR